MSVSLGSHLECQYELGTYGIPRQILPFDTEGHLEVDSFHRKIRQRREREESFRDSDSFVLPGKYDVLLGRGKPFQGYEGNLRLADWINENRSLYQAGERGHKSALSGELVDSIHKLGGRFLKKSDDGISWVEVNDEVARDKVGHGFRTRTLRNAGTASNA
jgi:hypothetical protein